MNQEISYNSLIEQFSTNGAQTQEWLLRSLEVANKSFGIWTKMSLMRDEVLEVVLPHHNRGGFEMIPPSGLTVRQVIERIPSIAEKYRRVYPQCLTKIHSLNRTGFTAPLILSSAPLSDVEDYKFIPIRSGGLYHVDGLHRMISMFYPISTSAEEIPCIIAHTDDFRLS